MLYIDLFALFSCSGELVILVSNVVAVSSYLSLYELIKELQ